jgi:hypothetical protein
MRSRRLALVPLVLVLAACHGPARVIFVGPSASPSSGGGPSDHERCLLDGRPAQLVDVEEEQARLSERVLRRQPIQTGVTLMLLLLGGASYLERLAVLLAARRKEGPTLADRIRQAMGRHRAHPVRYMAIVGGAVLLLGAAGSVYIYLDADKRASERALQQLQFCQLALKSAEADSALDEQRKNLDAIQTTAGSIKALVDSLPPEEQRKATLLLGQMKDALGNQHSMLARQAEVAKAVQAGSAEIQKDHGALSADVGVLRPLPLRLRELGDGLARLDERTRLGPDGKAPANLGEALAGLRAEVAAARAQVAEIDCSRARLPSGKTVGETLADLAARPPPVCRCEPAAAAARPDPGAR